MEETESVLVSVSIVVKAPVTRPLPEDAMTDRLQEEFLNAVADRLQTCVDGLRGEPWFEEDTGVNFHYLSQTSPAAEKNAGRCASCGRWTSDYNAPDFLDQLALGKIIDGRLLCIECRM